MPEHSRTKPDANQIASRIVEEVTESKDRKEKKNPHAVALGRIGGKKGGPARAKKLSAEKRKEIARKAALERWKKQKGAQST